MINRWSNNTLNNNMGYVAGNLVFSEAEIQRRHQLVRDELKRMDADLMIAQLCYPSASMALDPHITWLLGTPGYKGTETVILPADGELVMVHGSGQQGTLGTKCPYLGGAGAGMAEYIKGAKKIAYCHLGRISLQFYNFLKETCPGVEIVDFSEQIDLMKAVKSQEELDAIANATWIQDKLIEAAPAYIRPGRTQAEISAGGDR